MHKDAGTEKIKNRTQTAQVESVEVLEEFNSCLEEAYVFLIKYQKYFSL